MKKTKFRDVSVLSEAVSIYKKDGVYPLKLYSYQQDIFNAIVQRRYPRVHCITPTQAGKKLADNTPVLTNEGWKNHGDLIIGDYVFGLDGNKKKVLNTINDGKDIEYEIEFTNGETIQCHAQHEWVVEHKDWNRSKNPRRKLETQELLDNRDYKLFSLPLIEPVNLEEKELPIDPYVLGCWLGDGTSSSGSITYDENDVEHLEKIESLGYEVGKSWGKTNVKTSTIYKILPILKKLNLFNNKHIPDMYIYSSLNQRLELLAGLIDTDGNVNKRTRSEGWRNSRVEFTSVSKPIIDGIVEVIQSLGIRVCIKEIEPSTSSSGIVGRQKYYRIGFQPFIDIPTAVPRKKIVKLDKHRRIRIKDIRKIEPVNGKCITVEDGIYLAGKTLIPTHNSMTVGAAVLTRCMTHPAEKWAIVAPSTEKAMIIMRYIIDFCMSSKEYKTQLDMEEGQKNRLKREISKKRIVFKNDSQIFVLSADSRNKAAAGEALMGFGSPNIVLDESSLIDDDIYAKIKRMLGGHEDNFIFEIGNPFHRNHFFRTSHDDNYHHIWIDWKRAVKDGGLQKKFIDEMRGEAFFDVFYECKFPPQDMIDADGWTSLLPEDTLKNAMIGDNPNTYGEKRLGLDLARSGGNYNVWVLRTGNHAKIIARATTTNLMSIIGTTKDIAEKESIADNNIFIDATGMGAAVYDRFKETGWLIHGVVMNAKPQEKERYYNIRAEAFMRLREWIMRGGTLDDDNNFRELLDIKYTTRSNGKIQIIDKKTLRKMGIPSPDTADALMLTFAEPEVTNITARKEQIKIKQNKQPVYE